MDAVARLFRDHSAGLIDPTRAVRGNEKPALLKQVLREHQRWEGMPNRREPLTKQMLLWIIAHANHDQASPKLKALADWCILGIYFGFRLAEFLQTHDDVKRGSLQCNRDGRPQAFITADFNFYGPHRTVLQINFSQPIDPSLVDSMSICWRYQKNLQNGEIKYMARNDKNPQFCVIRAALRIRTRHASITKNELTPLAVYQERGRRAQLLTNKHMESLLREAAKAVYKITNRDHLHRFSCHSIRVGACVMLHLAGFTDTSIQFELRWKSTSFKDYLRNILFVAGAKRSALTDFDPDEVNF